MITKGLVNPITKTIVKPIDKPFANKEVYNYNGLNNYADGSLNPFASATGVCCIKFYIEFGDTVKNGARALVGNGWEFGIRSGSDNLFIIWPNEPQDVIQFNGFTLQPNESYTGEIEIDNNLDTVKWIVNGVHQTDNVVGTAALDPTFSRIGASLNGSNTFDGIIDIAIYDVGTDNKKEFTLYQNLQSLAENATGDLWPINEFDLNQVEYI